MPELGVLRLLVGRRRRAAAAVHSLVARARLGMEGLERVSWPAALAPGAGLLGRTWTGQEAAWSRMRRPMPASFDRAAGREGDRRMAGVPDLGPGGVVGVDPSVCDRWWRSVGMVSRLGDSFVAGAGRAEPVGPATGLHDQGVEGQLVDDGGGQPGSVKVWPLGLRTTPSSASGSLGRLAGSVLGPVLSGPGGSSPPGPSA